MAKKTKVAVEAVFKSGQKAPAFKLESTSGKTVSLKDFKGQNVVLYFYPKDNTSGCTVQGNDFSKKTKEFLKLNTVVIGVSPDSIKSHRSFIEKQSFTFDLLSDPDKVACDAYKVWKEKSMYGRKYFGVERSTFLIDQEGKVIKEWRKVKVPGHADEVLSVIQALA